MVHRLYGVLGVTKNATTSEIKRAYHQAALASHPDKVGESGTERFKEVQHAYSILSDLGKRKMYDTYGDQGMNIVEGGGLGPVMEHPLFGLFAAMIAWIVIFLLLLFTIFLALKIDGDRAEWNWATVFSPLWILESFALCGIASAVKGLTSNFEIRMVFSLTCLVAVFLVPITIVCGLEGLTSSWTGALSPILILVGLAFFTTIPGIAFQRYLEMCVANGLPTEGLSHSSPGYIVHVLQAVSGLLYPPFLWGFICAKLDGAIPYFTWWGVFVPVFIYLGISFLLTSASIVFHRPPGNEHGFCTTVVVPTIAQIIGHGFPLTFFCLLASRLEGGRISIAEVFIPLYFLLGTLLLVCMCVACLMCQKVGEAAQQSTMDANVDDEPGIGGVAPYAGAESA
jgi:hypothetical protein